MKLQSKKYVHTEEEEDDITDGLFVCHVYCSLSRVL